jgi:hypothetical protein
VRLQDTNGESESIVMSPTRKSWLQRINGSGAQQQNDNWLNGHVQASGAIGNKCNSTSQCMSARIFIELNDVKLVFPGDRDKGFIRRVKVITPENDKIQTVEPLIRIDVRRLRAAKINEDIVGHDPAPFESSDFVGSALLKPCFSPFQPAICAISTGKLPFSLSQHYSL